MKVRKYAPSAKGYASLKAVQTFRQNARSGLIKLFEQVQGGLLFVGRVAGLGINEHVGVDKAAISHSVNARWLRRG